MNTDDRVKTSNKQAIPEVDRLATRIKELEKLEELFKDCVSHMYSKSAKDEAKINKLRTQCLMLSSIVFVLNKNPQPMGAKSEFTTEVSKYLMDVAKTLPEDTPPLPIVTVDTHAHITNKQ